MEFVKYHDDLVCQKCLDVKSNRNVYNQPWGRSRIFIFDCESCGAVNKVQCLFKEEKLLPPADQKKLKERTYGAVWQ